MEECYYRSEILHTDLFGKKDNFGENVADIFAPVTFALMMIVTFSNGVLLLRLSKTSQTKYNETKTWRKLEVLVEFDTEGPSLVLICLHIFSSFSETLK